MPKSITLLLVLLSFFYSSFSQQLSVKGSVTDTADKKMLVNSSILLLRKSDSVLVRFTRSDKQGNFMLKNLPPGKFILLVSYPLYGDYVDEMVLTDSPLDLHRIMMTPKSQLLKEVIVNSVRGAVRIKGDTTEYKVDSFYMRQGATVEDLLKKLPGIQVDKNGKITAQGEVVQKILVDGEEFFSDDPTIVTRSLQAESLDKVQVYDKKSDQAAFTGIDDGKKTKTIDLKLKDDKKKGYFGKLELGSDANKYWNNNVMINAFKKKRQISAYGIMSNTGKTGLDWNENMNYGGNSAMETGMSDDGGMYIMMSGDNEFSGSSNYGDGLPKGWAAGLHYADKWDNEKQHFSGNYQNNKLDVAASGTTQSEYILPDTLYFVNQRGNSYNTKSRNKMDGLYELQIDSLSSIKVTAGGSMVHSSLTDNSFTESLDKFGTTVNNSSKKTTSAGDNNTFNSTLLWKQKFKKQGRTISVSANQKYNDNMNSGLLFANNRYYDSTTLVENDSIDQNKINHIITSAIEARAIYTEPLSKKSLLQFNYGINSNDIRSQRTALGKSNPLTDKYDEVIDSLTNDYKYNVFSNAAGITYRYSKPKKISFSFGGNISKANYTRRDLRTDSITRYSFISVYPQANLNLSIGQTGNLRIGYNGRTQAPTIDQIQPVKDNSNPLYVTVGNPGLKQAFRNNISISYNSFKFLSERSIFGYGDFTFVENDFSNISSIDNLGRTITQPVNVSGNYNFYANVYYDRKIKKPGLNTGLNVQVNGNHVTNYVNGLQNVSNTNAFGGGMTFRYEKEKKFSLVLNPAVFQNITNSSIRTDIKTSYLTQEHRAEFNFFLPWKMEFNTDCTFYIRQKANAFETNNNSTKWNAHLDRKILKNDVARIRLAAFDILDQNIGFQRNINSNLISQQNYETIRRYVMLSLIWNFSKNGKPQQW